MSNQSDGPQLYDLDQVTPLVTGEQPAQRAERLQLLSKRWSLSTWVAFWLLTLVITLITAQTVLTFLALWASNRWLAALVGGVGGIAFLTLSVWALRELRAIFRLRTAGKVQRDARDVIQHRDEAGAQRLLPAIERLHQPSYGGAIEHYRQHQASSPSALEKLDQFERSVLAEADARAQGRIIAASRDSAIFTALSPFASLDVVISLWRNLKMIREIAEIYGLAPNWHQSARLLRKALFQGVVAGGMEAGDGLLNNLLGRGIAGQLSVKLGEGMVNALMTSRIGLASIEECRAMPFNAVEKPKLGTLATEIAKQVTAQVSTSVGDAIAPSKPKRSTAKAQVKSRASASNERPARTASAADAPQTVDRDATSVRPVDPLD